MIDINQMKANLARFRQKNSTITAWKTKREPLMPLMYPSGGVAIPDQDAEKSARLWTQGAIPDDHTRNAMVNNTTGKKVHMRLSPIKKLMNNVDRLMGDHSLGGGSFSQRRQSMDPQTMTSTFNQVKGVDMMKQQTSLADVNPKITTF